MNNSFTVFSKVEDVWKAQLADIRSAKQSILLEQYIIEDFLDGHIGKEFIDTLTAKLTEGVEVRCILDIQGSFDLFKNIELNNRFTKAGGKILYYKTVGSFQIINPFRLLLRDHRKLLLIDHTISWIGGVVIGERFRKWDDLMVRFTNSDIADVLNKEFKNQILRLENKCSLLAPLVTIDPHTHISGNAPGIGNRFCYEELCHAIMRARESVIMVTPYFAPPIKLQRVLSRRLSEGLSITLLVPRKCDKKIIDLARESYMKEFLKKGLKLKYADHMIHAKFSIVDGLWMTFGSTNLDAVSLIFNHELNIVSRDSDLIAEVSTVYKEWTKNLSDITFSSCEYQKQSVAGRLIGRLVRSIA